jgi:hypothetical protein
MNRILSSRAIEKELEKRGLIPPNCHFLNIDIPVTGAMSISYKVFITTDKLADLADALRASVDTENESERHRLERAGAAKGEDASPGEGGVGSPGSGA